MVVGGFLSVIGLALSCYKNELFEFGYSWLLAFMFYYSLALGALFLVMVHHLTGAGWSLGIRRFCEHLASSARLAIDRDVSAGRNFCEAHLSVDELVIRLPIISWRQNIPCSRCPASMSRRRYFFAILWFLSWRLSSLSLQQDKTGAPECTRKMCFHSGWGIVALALLMTFPACSG